MITFKDLYFESIQSEIKKLKADVYNNDMLKFSNNGQLLMYDADSIKLYNKLIYMITNYKYEKSVEFIDNIVKDPKLRFLLALGYGGQFADLKLKITSIQLPTKKLIPTQSEIDMTNSLKHTLVGKDINTCFYDPVVIIRPIVTFKGRYVIDGHHRWSQIYITNPDSNLACLDIDGQLSPMDMLKAVQSTIGTNLGYLESRRVKGTSIYDASENVIRNYVKKNISNKTINELKQFIKEDPIDYLTKNTLTLADKNKPIKNAPERGFMPQTSHDPKLFVDLQNGVAKPVKN